jgi:hypothetical protein
MIRPSRRDNSSSRKVGALVHPVRRSQDPAGDVYTLGGETRRRRLYARAGAIVPISPAP